MVLNNFWPYTNSQKLLFWYFRQLVRETKSCAVV